MNRVLKKNSIANSQVTGTENLHLTNACKSINEKKKIILKKKKLFQCIGLKKLLQKKGFKNMENLLFKSDLKWPKQCFVF